MEGLGGFRPIHTAASPSEAIDAGRLALLENGERWDDILSTRVAES